MSGLVGSPTWTDLTLAMNFSMNFSLMLSWTKTRDPAQQTCPALKKIPNADQEAAASRSASSKMTLGDFPPSSRVTVLRLLSAASFMIVRPTRVDPVKATFWIFCCTKEDYHVNVHSGRSATRAGETNHVRGDGGSDVDTVTVDEVEDSLGKTSLVAEGGDSEGGERRELTGLEDDGVSGSERGSKLPTEHDRTRTTGGGQIKPEPSQNQE